MRSARSGGSPMSILPGTSTKRLSLRFSIPLPFRPFPAFWTGRANSPDGTLKRYDDTALLVREVLSNGLDSDRARRAFARINDMHGRFRIANDDFLYVLSTFVFTPIDWLDRFGRRAMTDEEKEDWFLYWREFGRRMGIANLPADIGAFRSFANEFEKNASRERHPTGRLRNQPSTFC